MKQLRVGLVSFAHTHATSYARYLASAPGEDLVANDGGEGERGTLRGAEFAQQMGLRYVPDVATLLAERPDAVVVAAENADHRDLVEQAVAAGAHVLCEKPLATTDADADAMVQAAREAGVLLMTAYAVRFSPGFAQRVGRVRDGGLGRVLSVRGTDNGQMPAAGG